MDEPYLQPKSSQTEPPLLSLDPTRSLDLRWYYLMEAMEISAEVKYNCKKQM